MNSKKRIILIVVGLIIAALIFITWRLLGSNGATQQQIVYGKYKKPSLENRKEVSLWKEYKNVSLNYDLKYPNNWYVFDEEKDFDFWEVPLDENFIVEQGGAVFWSNKENINFTEENLPKDFLLLGLITYRKAGIELESFAEALGFTDSVGSDSLSFEADGVVGREYFSLGTTDEEPRVVIIFKKDDVFYVFHLGFVGDDRVNLESMEKIVGSFHFKE